jgi:ribosomal protein S27AE
MTSNSASPYEQVQHELAAWHATHPDATLAEIERAVETQIERLRADLLDDQTSQVFVEERPQCQECGGTMTRQTRQRKRVVLRGDETLDLDRSSVVCPQCGAGLFPPG